MACGCEGAKCGLEPGDKRHGTANGYTNRGCRCGACREAQREYQKARYEPRVARLEPGDSRHGTPNGYGNYRCRCDACREAQREASREHLEAKREREKVRYEAKREVILERARARYAANLEASREAQRGRGRVYRDAHREAQRERGRVYRSANRELIRERMRAYQAANPDGVREREALRRARKANATIGPAFTRQQVWDRDNGTCHICGQPADPDNWHMDHVVPLARGGAHSFDGCAVSHPLCNLRKGTRLLDELAAECSMDAVQ